MSSSSLAGRRLGGQLPSAEGIQALPGGSYRRAAASAAATQAKVGLNRAAFDRMTLALQRERAPLGEVAGWLRTIDELIRGTSVR